MPKFVGITIGPIFDTIMDASTPAALWFASSIFSDITRRICIGVEKNFENAKIYSPYYAKNIHIHDGVGKFHDRIIFSTEQYDHVKLKSLIKEVKTKTIDNFPKQFNNKNSVLFLEQYLQIHYVVLEKKDSEKKDSEKKDLEKKNCILALSPYLDTLELMRTFPEDDSKNIFRRLFLGEEEAGNIYIKQSKLFTNIESDKNQFKKNKECIWTISEISSDHEKITEKLKRKDYYALVKADGDGMGKFLETLENTIVTNFSEACLSYDEKVSEIIAKYGGMTIYAGGDDLLFLAPVINQKGDNIFDLCINIRKLFQEYIIKPESLKNSKPVPTVSFGITIQYKKYPLYEAVKKGEELLKLAKSCDKQKDKMAIYIQKHSGSNVTIIVPNINNNVLKEVLNPAIAENEKIVNSVIYTLEHFKHIIYVMNNKVHEGQMDAAAYEEAFMNLFDHLEQKVNENYFKGICSTYFKYFVNENDKIIVPADDIESECNPKSKEEDKSLKTFLYLLWIKKFLLEKEGDK